MAFIHTLLFIAHILVGGAALVLFWIPIWSKKGQLNHVMFGRYYRTAMYAVAGTGAIMATMVIAMPMSIKPGFFMNASDPDKVVFSIRLFWFFLLYLSLLSFTTTRHGIAVLKAKKDNASMRVWHYQLPLWMLLIGGVGCFALGLMYDKTLHIVFGVLGIVMGQSTLRYCWKKEIQPGEWVVEHLGAMIGSGIGAYTAFLAFGGRTLFADLGSYQMIFWIAPGLIGGIAANIIARNYGKKLRLTL